MLYQLTDGQIFLETEFYFIEEYALQINAGLSVSTCWFCSSIKKQ
jgi:F0F1-type ATP synthase alpha subunit